MTSRGTPGCVSRRELSVAVSGCASRSTWRMRRAWPSANSSIRRPGSASAASTTSSSGASSCASAVFPVPRSPTSSSGSGDRASSVARPTACRHGTECPASATRPRPSGTAASAPSGSSTATAPMTDPRCTTGTTVAEHRTPSGSRIRYESVVTPVTPATPVMPATPVTPVTAAASGSGAVVSEGAAGEASGSGPDVSERASGTAVSAASGSVVPGKPTPSDLSPPFASRSSAATPRSSASNPSGDSKRPAASLTRRLRPSRATTACPCSRAARRYASNRTRSAGCDRARSAASTAPAAASAREAHGCGAHSAQSPEVTVTVPTVRPVSGASTGTLTADTSCHRSRKCSGPCTSARRRVRSASAALLLPTTCSERSSQQGSPGAHPVAHSTRSRSSVSRSAVRPVPTAGASRSSTGRAAASRADSSGRTVWRGVSAALPGASGAESGTSCRRPKNRARLQAATISSGTPSGSSRPSRNNSRALRSDARAGWTGRCSAVVTTPLTVPGEVEGATTTPEPGGRAGGEPVPRPLERTRPRPRTTPVRQTVRTVSY